MSILSNYHDLEKFAGPDMVRQINNEKLRSINPCPFLCQSKVREFLLNEAKRTRAHVYTRVSGQTMIEINEAVRVRMMTIIARLPSMGRTI